MASVSLFLRAAVAGTVLALSPGIGAADPLHIYAAGSLTAAFTDIVEAFPALPGEISAPVFGPSGVLRQRIQQGEPVDLFASADMAHPRALAHGQTDRFVVMFTRNRLCALGWERLSLSPNTLLEALLSPSVRLATSTPGADPGGDYAWAVFARAERIRPGAQAILETKAMQLVGGPNTPPLIPGRGAVQGIFLSDRADIVLGYCSSAGPVMREVPGLARVNLPPTLSVGPAYGLIVLSQNKLAERFALFVLSEPGQAILARHGFDPIGVADPPP